MPTRNYHSLTYLLTGVRCRATSVAKNSWYTQRQFSYHSHWSNVLERTAFWCWINWWNEWSQYLKTLVLWNPCITLKVLIESFQEDMNPNMQDKPTAPTSSSHLSPTQICKHPLFSWSKSDQFSVRRSTIHNVFHPCASRRRRSSLVSGQAFCHFPNPSSSTFLPPHYSSIILSQSYHWNYYVYSFETEVLWICFKIMFLLLVLFP